MNKVSIILTTLVIAASAYAQMGHSVSKNAKHVITCPVTGDKVDMDKWEALTALRPPPETEKSTYGSIAPKLAVQLLRAAAKI